MKIDILKGLKDGMIKDVTIQINGVLQIKRVDNSLEFHRLSSLVADTIETEAAKAVSKKGGAKGRK